MIKPSIILSFLLLLFARTSSAQTLLRGVVYDKHVQAPLPQVEVVLLDLAFSAFTDQRGSFKIEGVPAGVHKVRFSRRGYRSVIRTFEVKNERVYSTAAGLLPVGIGQGREELDDPHGYHRDPYYSPYAQTRIHLGTWEQRQWLTLAEGLGNHPLFWRVDPHYATGSMHLRGLGPEHLNWNFEGLPLSPSSQRPEGWLPGALIDPHTLEKIEVQRGTGGLLYGPAGSAGTIHLHSQVPAFSGQGTQVHGRALFQGQSPSDRYGGHARVSLHRPGLATQFAGSWFQWNDLQAPAPLDSLPGSGFGTRQFQSSSRLRLSPRHSLTLGYRLAEQRGANLFTPLRPTPWPNQRDLGRHQLAWLRLIGDYESAWWRQVRLSLGFQQLKEERSQAPGQTGPVLSAEEQIDTWSARFEVKSVPNAYWHVVSGVSVLHETVGSSRQQAIDGNGTQRLPGTLPDAATLTQMGVYSLHTFDLLKLHVVAGVRGQANLRQGLAPEGAVDQWQNLHVSYNVSGMYPLSKQYQLVSNLQSGYRAPGLFELGGISPLANGLAVPADSGLRGERSFTSELGLKANTKRFRGSVMLYRTFLRDRIGYQAGQYQGDDTYLGLPVYQATNQQEGYVAGVEASLKVPVARMLSLYGGVVYSYGEDLRRGQPLAGIPPVNTRLGGYFHHRVGIWGRVEWRYAARQDRIALLDRNDPAIGPDGVAAWHLIDLQAGYDFAWGQFTVGLYNLLDRYAQPFGAAVPQPGRRVLGSLQVNF